MQLRKNSNLKTYPQKKYSHLALGGTFDIFHAGHRHFLNSALQLAERITLGITGDELARQIHASEKLQAFHKRKQTVEAFLAKQDVLPRVKIIKLVDVYGTTVSDDTLEALLVTENTLEGARLINEKRRKFGKSELGIAVCTLLHDEEGKLLASHRIRKGEINREGRNYYRLLLAASPYQLPQVLKHEFREPFGKTVAAETRIYETMKKVLLILKIQQLHPVICVGDVVTHAFLKVGGIPQIKIIDLHVERKRRYRKLSEIGPIERLTRYAVVNPPSHISRELLIAIHKAFANPQPSVIKVRGEEDLAVLPAVLLAPLGSAVLYGHYKLGVVLVTVNEAKKNEALDFMKKLIPFGSAKL